jgi:hypothetical protein
MHRGVLAARLITLLRIGPRGGQWSAAIRLFGTPSHLSIPAITSTVVSTDHRGGRAGHRLRRHIDQCAAADLAQALGCLPLALSHAAAYCQSSTSLVLIDVID